MFLHLESKESNLTINNTIIRQNEQSLVVNVCELEPEDSRGL